MERIPVIGDEGWRWTLATTPDDGALFIPKAAIPENADQGCSITVYVRPECIILDMSGINVRLQPAHPAVVVRLLSMDNIVVAEQGGERCWVASISRTGESAKVRCA